MQITPEEFMKLCAPISERDAEIATLRKELEQFRGRAGEVVETQADARHRGIQVRTFLSFSVEAEREEQQRYRLRIRGCGNDRR